MEQTTQIGRDITYYHNQSDDKHYFGGFLNLAQNNIQQVVDEFCVRLGLKQRTTDRREIEVILSYFQLNISHTDWERGAKILKDYLPVVDHIDLPTIDKMFDNVRENDKENAKREYFRTTWRELMNTMNSLRSYYTHYYHPPVSISEPIASFLDRNLLNVCLDVKKQKMKTDKTKQALKQGIDEQLEKLKELKKLELKELKAKLEREGKKPRISFDNLEAAIYNDAFKHLISKTDNGGFELKDYYKTKLQDGKKYGDLNIDFSLGSLAFLLSMFLSKKEIEQFKSNLFGFKGKVIKENEDYEITQKNNALKFMATHWVFSHLAFKGLKRRVKNTFDKETLLMQMVDELNKVPHEVYRNLSKDEQAKFVEDINEYVQDNPENEKTHEESTIVHPIIRKRYESKFNYFAVRFLDEFADFPTLRFFIHTGNYVHDRREKPIPGGHFVSDRMIKEKINVFARLSEVSKVKSDYFSKRINNEELSWELYPNPNYIFENQNIPVYIDLKKWGKIAGPLNNIIEKAKEKHNPTKPRGSRLTKKEIIDIIYDQSQRLKYIFGDPTLLLNAKELQALLYELLDNKKSGEELENIIVSKMVEHCNTIWNYSGEEELSKHQITKKLRKSITSTGPVDHNKMIRALEREMEIGNEKLETIQKNRIEVKEEQFKRKHEPKGRKHVFYTKELGQEATWLAYDIVRFMPKEKRADWKGHHHSELQRFLAFYDRNKEDAIQLLSAYWDYKNDNFFGKELFKAFGKRDFDYFYESYLNSRNEVLLGLKNGIEGFRDEPKALKKILKDFYKIFNKRFYTLKPASEQKELLFSKPICLPRGIFDEKPTFIRGVKAEDSPEQFAKWYTFTYKAGHKFQGFYKRAREYQEEFNKQKEENEKWRKRGFEQFKMDQDLAIKAIKAQDVYVKLMVDYLFEQTFNRSINMSLADLYQNAKERYSIQREANLQHKREVGDCSENILNETYIWNKAVPISICNGQIVEPQVKIKDIGKCRKLETDSKVLQLLEYDKERVWRKLEIEDEMENKPGSYERIRREELLKEVQGFEKYILEREGFDGQNHPASFLQDGNPNFKMYIINGGLRRIPELRTVEIDMLLDIEHVDIDKLRNTDQKIQLAYLLILLRNKFGHNQLLPLPAYELLNTHFQKQEKETYSEYLLRCCKLIINSFK